MALKRCIYCDTEYKALQAIFCHLIIYNSVMQPDKPLRGRPPLNPEDRLVHRSVRLTPAQWAMVDLQGVQWLRSLIDRARAAALRKRPL